jgi:hypothetical protein
MDREQKRNGRIGGRRGGGSGRGGGGGNRRRGGSRPALLRSCGRPPRLPARRFSRLPPPPPAPSGRRSAPPLLCLPRRGQAPLKDAERRAQHRRRRCTAVPPPQPLPRPRGEGAGRGQPRWVLLLRGWRAALLRHCRHNASSTATTAVANASSSSSDPTRPSTVPAWKSRWAGSTITCGHGSREPRLLEAHSICTPNGCSAGAAKSPASARKTAMRMPARPQERPRSSCCGK